MDLGNFSISLAVKDLGASRAFYEKFGIKVFAGDGSQGWLGPASFIAVDPDGNPILVDQHV